MKSPRRARQARLTPRSPAAASKRSTPKFRRPPGSIPFPEARGKTLAEVYLSTDVDSNCVVLAFSDNTELLIDVEPSLAFSADYSDWNTGNQRVLRRWPRVRSG